MTRATLFHLHFNTSDVEAAADRLARAGVPARRRFGSVRGESVALEPTAETPDGFRFKLQVHRRGGVNVTLAPGQRPHFDHLGLTTGAFEDVLDRAASKGWSARRNERRTFVMTPWGFRVEVHPPDDDVVAGCGDFDEARIEEALLRLPDADAARSGFDDVFGGVRGLHVDSGEEPWLESFAIVGDGTTQTVDVATLLGGQDAPA